MLFRSYGYGYSIKNQEVKVVKLREPRVTKKVDELIEIELSNGKKEKCTPDHKFMLRNGKYKKAEDLKPKDELMPHTEYIEEERRYIVSPKFSYKGNPSKRGKKDAVFHLAYKLNKKENKRKKKFKSKDIQINIHHKDFNRLNDLPKNLKIMKETKHRILHAKKNISIC